MTLHAYRWRCSILRDERGIAGIEFALVASILCILLLNGIDVGRYTWIRMQVENAAQIGAQTVWKICDPNKLPLSKCEGPTGSVTTAVTTAIENSTSLKDDVTLDAMSGGFYCVNSDGVLTFIDEPQVPATCEDYGKEELFPGYYVEVAATYTYAPLFADVTIARLFAGAITKTSRVRLQ